MQLTCIGIVLGIMIPENGSVCMIVCDPQVRPEPPHILQMIRPVPAHDAQSVVLGLGEGFVGSSE